MFTFYSDLLVKKSVLNAIFGLDNAFKIKIDSFNISVCVLLRFYSCVKLITQIYTTLINNFHLTHI